MKTVAMILTSLFVWSSAQAAEELPIKKLQCGQPAFESAYIELNPNGYDPSYNIVRGQNARLIYNYSSTENMVCTGSKVGDIDCVGFWSFPSKEVAYLQLRKEGKKIVALWRTNQLYGAIEMKTICEEVVE